jgi:predicted nucleic acid-binding protein
VARYLADTSIWTWARKASRPDIAAKLSARVARDEILTCVPVVLEATHGSDTGARYEALYTTVFEPLDWLPLTEVASLRALDVQRALAARSDGRHRRSPVDLLIAAIAEVHQEEDVVLWAFDEDFQVISEETGQPVELEASTGPGH